MSERKTPAEWCRAKSIRILDPDGWRSDGDPAWDVPIPEDEFDRRASVSTQGPWDWGDAA